MVSLESMKPNVSYGLERSAEETAPEVGASRGVRGRLKAQGIPRIRRAFQVASEATRRPTDGVVYFGLRSRLEDRGHLMNPSR